MPVGVCQDDDNRHKDREGLRFVVFEDAEEKVIFEEAHGAVRDLEVGACDAFDESFEELVDVWLEFGDVADIEDFQ